MKQKQCRRSLMDTPSKVPLHVVLLGALDEWSTVFTEKLLSKVFLFKRPTLPHLIESLPHIGKWNI